MCFGKNERCGKVIGFYLMVFDDVVFNYVFVEDFVVILVYIGIYYKKEIIFYLV